MMPRINQTWALGGLGLVSWLIYVAISGLSRQFIHGTGWTERPILAVLGLLALAFGLHLLALWVALRGPSDRRLTTIILLGAAAFRVALLPSVPIQEVDIYRYLWDGASTMAGVSPFRYSPQQVLEARPLEAQRDSSLPDDLQRLVDVRDESDSRTTILQRVHYGELPTIYPPVSQAVFAVSAFLTPARVSLEVHLTVMKAILVLFDLGTLLLVLLLLRVTGKHVGWSIAYGWCPLVLKEFAGSGHLDAIAIFLTTGAIAIAACTIRWPAERRRRQLAQWFGAALLLALAVGAKIYPIVLTPWLVLQGWRRFGAGPAIVTGLLVVGLSAALLWPLRPREREVVSIAAQPIADGEFIDLPPPPDEALSTQDPSKGLLIFLNRWEMNDFLFLLLVENLKPSVIDPDEPQPWFSCVPETWRQSLVAPIASSWGQSPNRTAFLLTRAATGLVFFVLAFVLAARVSADDDLPRWLEAAFLTLAWFWLLAPTQNPWYWIWALPLIPFARNRAWLALSGLVLVYYLRFWLIYHRPEPPVLGTGYNGVLFFDFVVTWLEFAPWFVWLFVSWKRPGAKGARQSP